jgi:hypothetical protein
MMRRTGLRRRHRLTRGQALVETALIAPLLIFLIGGAGQFAVLVYSQLQIDTATREGARVASTQPNNSGAFVHASPAAAPTVCPIGGTTPDPSKPICDAVWSSVGDFPNPHQFTISVAPLSAPGSPSACPSPSFLGDGYLSVSVSYNSAIVVPLMNTLFGTSGGSSRTLTATEVIRVNPCGVTEFEDSP